MILLLNGSVVMTAIEQDGKALRFAPDHLKNDPDLLRIAREHAW